MRKPVFTAVLLSLILLSGVVVTSMVSFIDVEASSDKKDKKHKEKDRDKGYAKKDYDSFKYDSDYQYPSDQYYNGYQMEDYAAEKDPYSDGYQKDGYASEKYDEHKYKSDDKVIYKNKDKKKVKNIKIIECKNVNVNADELKDITTAERLHSNNPILNNLENKLKNQINGENEITGYDQYNDGIYEFYVGPDTKIIFICTNENYDLDNKNNHYTTNAETSIPSSAMETSENADVITTADTTEANIPLSAMETENADVTTSSCDCIDSFKMQLEATPDYFNIIK